MFKKGHPKILMVYIEPTPYMLNLIDAIIPIWNGKIDVLFLVENLTQKWDIALNQKWMVLPKKRISKIQLIIKLMFKGQYDMFHVAGWGEPLCLLFIIMAKLLRIPVSVETDASIPIETKFWKRIIKCLFYPPLFSFVNIFLPGGTRQAKYLEYYSVNPQRIIPAKMTVDVVYIKKYVQSLTSTDRHNFRKHFDIDDNEVVFLFVGRLEKFKGITDLITAFNDFKYKNATLLIVGDGRMRHQINETVNKNRKIHYAGRLSGDDIIKAYYSVDVLVLPSHFEPWGLVINEAMAVGRPVILSDRVGCIDDLVIHQETGLVVKAGDSIELRSAMEYIANEPHIRDAMAKKSALIIENWTLENEARKICQAWKKVV